MKPTCQEISESLSGYIDGEITAETKRDIAAHLEQCPTCGDKEKNQRSVKVAMRNPALRQAAPHDVRARIMRAIERHPERVSFGALLRRLFEFQPLPSIATAVLLIALSTTIALWGGRKIYSDPASQPPLAILMNSQMEGEVVCVDCESLTLTKTPFVHGATHRLGLRCNDGHFWNILQTAKGSELSSVENLMHRRIVVRGHVFPAQHLVEITDYSVI